MCFGYFNIFFHLLVSLLVPFPQRLRSRSRVIEWWLNKGISCLIILVITLLQVMQLLLPCVQLMKGGSCLKMPYWSTSWCTNVKTEHWTGEQKNYLSRWVRSKLHSKITLFHSCFRWLVPLFVILFIPKKLIFNHSNNWSIFWYLKHLWGSTEKT